MEQAETMEDFLKSDRDEIELEDVPRARVCLVNGKRPRNKRFDMDPALLLPSMPRWEEEVLAE